MPTKKKATRKRSTRKKVATKKAARKKPTGTPRRKVPNPALPEILDALAAAYPDAHCELNYRDEFQLLVATILSAQCTDVRVNMVTQDLFEKYRGPADYLAVPAEELEEDIRTTGFFRNKTKNIRAACREILETHGGKVPKTMRELSALGGVGRKTANVVLGNAWNDPDGVVVDTHVKRVSYKLALTNEQDPVKIERDLNAIIPRDEWVMFGHRMIFHGRRVCKAPTPLCDRCSLYPYCPTRA